MATANIKAVITAEDKASKVISGFSKTSALAFGAVAGIAQSVVTKAIDAVTESVGSAVKRVDTLNNANRAFANMGFAAGDVKGAMDNLNKSILGLPTPLDQAVSGMQMFASTIPDIGRAQSVFSAVNDAIIGFGGSADMVDSAVLQMSQAFSNGRIDAQTWNSMMNSQLGPTLNAIAKQMGITTGQLKEGLSDGTYSVQQFQDSLISLDKNGGGGLKSLQNIAHDATSGIGTGLENAKTAITRGMANIISAIGTKNISNAISGVGTAVEKLFTSIANISKSVDFGAFFDKIKQAIDFLTPAFNELWNTIETKVWPSLQKLWKDVLEPLAPFLGAVLVANIYATVKVWNILATAISIVIDVVVSLVNFFKNTLWPAISSVIGFIAEKVTYMKDHFWESIGAIIGFFATLPIKIPAFVAAAIIAAIRWIASIDWGAIFSGIWNALKNGALSAWNFIKNIRWGDILIGVGKGIGNAVIGLVEGAINGALSGIPGKPKVRLPRFANGVENFAGGLAIVGERGPELVSLPRGSSVKNATETSKMSGSTIINISPQIGVFTGSNQEMRKLSNEIVQALRDVANSKNMTVMELLA